MFKARVDSEAIELLHTGRPVGTTIRVKIADPDIWNTLLDIQSWDWYCLSEPKVARSIHFEKPIKREQVLNQQFSLPLPKADLPVPWNRVLDPAYSDIQWNYDKDLPLLTCNGISVIGRHHDYYGYDRDQRIDPLWTSYPLQLACPIVSVFDPDSHLPLLLQRTGLAEPKYPFHSVLLENVIRDLLAFILVNAPRGPIHVPALRDSYGLWYKGFDRDRVRWLPFFSLEGEGHPLSMPGILKP